jgi:hypothetical protein
MNKDVENRIISCMFWLSDPRNGAQVEIIFDENNEEIQIQAIKSIAVVHSIPIHNFMNMPIEIFCNLCRSIEKDAKDAA